MRMRMRMRKQTTPILSFIVISFLPHCFMAIELKKFSTEYGLFNQTSYKSLKLLGGATINNNGLQVTPDTINIDKIRFMSGRVLLKQRFKLWEEEGNATASFNTSFLFTVYAIAPGQVPQGLAFVIAPDLLLLRNSDGPFLGLTSSETDGDQDNKLVAVELDSFKDEFDPNDNHVGIDVNSVRSIKNESLTPHNITLTNNPMDNKARFYNTWVDYDGLNKLIHVYIAEQADLQSPTPPKPDSPILSAELNLRDYVAQYSYLGFSASTGYDGALNVVLRWNMTVHHFGETTISPHFSIWLVVGLVVVAGVAAGIWYRHKTASSTSNLVQTLKRLPGMPREFRFRHLRKATGSFDERNKLGQGGFGVVYKGLLVEEKVEIAVKLFSRETVKSQLDFIAELTVINRLRHKHLVKLLGWCNKKGKLLLVYEYMPNSSLDRHLFIGPNIAPLPWNLRCKIIKGVASALHYLHYEYDHKVIHRDLKASNIMLDCDFNARLGDFGLAKVLDNEKTSYAEEEGVRGTMGYIAPECLLTGKATRQSDVYAFGAVLLEVVCGQRPGTRIAGFQFLVDWVWMLHRDNKLEEAVDGRLGNEYVKEEAEILLLLGLACSHPNGSERPNTQDLLHMISGTMPVPAIPSFKPAFQWAAPAGGVVDVDSVNTMSITVSDFGR